VACGLVVNSDNLYCRMKKFVVQIFLLIVVIFAALYFGVLGPASTGAPVFGPKPTSIPRDQFVKIKDTLIRVEIADTQEERAKGLGGRQSLASDSGMLFVFPKADQYTFWMKGLSFPLDMIWLSNKRVIDIMKNVPPPTANQSDADLPRYKPLEPADMILEVNAGFVDQHNIKVGDTVEIQ
jgi:uncharacterized membrane protein (UPF0127 family)